MILLATLFLLSAAPPASNAEQSATAEIAGAIGKVSEEDGPTLEARTFAVAASVPAGSSGRWTLRAFTGGTSFVSGRDPYGEPQCVDCDRLSFRVGAAMQRHWRMGEVALGIAALAFNTPDSNQGLAVPTAHVRLGKDTGFTTSLSLVDTRGPFPGLGEVSAGVVGHGLGMHAGVTIDMFDTRRWLEVRIPFSGKASLGFYGAAVGPGLSRDDRSGITAGVRFSVRIP